MSETLHYPWIPSLRSPESVWPMETSVPDKKEIDKERRKVEIVCPFAVARLIFDPKIYSKWKRVIRVTSYVRRFIQNCRNKFAQSKGNQQPETGPLTSQELETAEDYWLKQMQSSITTRLPKGDFKIPFSV